MNRHHRSCIAIVESVGFDAPAMERRGKHLALRIGGADRVATVFFRCTPPDPRWAKNARALVRRAVREEN
ncbi:hypothetical protein ABIE65_003642 [Constrictibacter sp. MBR-5]|jgi:hypothetical protein|uniref:hypothetical protein n=1 Tax=Constrictibacter sp. MBR-5 TaxID=3156467 RepID=UPI0033997D80